MAGEKPDVLLIGATKPVMVKGLEPKVTPALSGRCQGPGRIPQIDRRQVRAIAHRLYREQARRRVHAAVAEARESFEFRRRLRSYRRQMGRRTWHHRHQHARSAQRRGRRHRARLLLCTVREFPQAERYLRAGKWPAGSYPLTQGNAAQPHRRHGRHGPHRPGDRAAARRLRRAGGLSFAAARNGVGYKHYPNLVAMARDVDTLLVIVPGGAGDREHDQRRGARGARAERHPHQHGARLGGRRAGADRGA